MSFINNPVVSSLAGAIGLGGLTNQGSPLVASAAPKIAPKASAPNQPEYKQARFFDPRSPQGARGSAPSGMPTEPGAMSPDVQNNPTVMDLLQHFGVHPQQEIDPHLFIHNAQAWANHPVMSGVLEGLLSGAANTKGSDTLGEGISNVAQGLAATHDQQIQHINAQLQMPYQQAMTVASLQDQAGKQSLQEAQQKEAVSRAHYYDDVLDARQQQTQTTVQGRTDVANVKANQARDVAEAHMKAAGMKPQSASAAQWQGLFKGNLASATKNRDLTQEPETPEEIYAATQKSLEDLQGPGSAKTRSAVATKGATPGSSAAAMLNANKTPDAQTKADYTEANRAVEDWTKMKPSQKYAVLGKAPTPDEDKAELNRRMATRDAARGKLPGPVGSKAVPSTPKYSANNPFATKQ
jgi:hypothetical protein